MLTSLKIATAPLTIATVISSTAFGGGLVSGDTVLDPPGIGAQGLPAAQTPNIRFVKNFPYANGTDIEFGAFDVPVTQPDGTVVTERHEYAFAGAHDNPSAVRIFDITNPEAAFVASEVRCNLYQADIQLRVDLGLLVVGQDRNTSACGLGGTQGIVIFDVRDPRSPVQLGVFKWARGAHNSTFHPTKPYVYLSDSDVAPTAGLGEIAIVDVSDPAAPKLASRFQFGVHSPHDITFNAKGDRAYTSSITHSDILDTTDPVNPTLISTINDPSINIHHQSDPTPDGRYLVISDELAGAATGPQCPGGGLHFYDISSERTPVPAGVFFANTTAQASLCTAHVFRINPDGKTLVIGWYNAGTRVVDISNPVGLGAREIASIVPSGMGGNEQVANSWASKMYRDNFIYSNDRRRGLDILQLVP